MIHTAKESSVDSTNEIDRLRAEVTQLQNQRVEDWVRLIRFGSVIPRSVENSLSWKLTRPVRLLQTAYRVLQRDGLNQFLATAGSRVRRLVTRR